MTHEHAPTTDQVVHLPLSARQRAWWEQNSGRVSQVPCHLAAYELAGPVDPERLRSAVDRVTARHDVLRTVLRQLEDGPVRVVLPEGTALATVAHPAGGTGWGQEAALDHVMAAATGLDPGVSTCGVELLVLRPDWHLLVLRLHPLTADAGSLPRLAAHVLAAYAGEPTAQAPRPMAGPGDVAGEPDLRAQLDFWRHELAGFRRPAPDEELASTADPATDTDTSGELALGSTLVDGLRAFAAGHRTSEFVVVLAAVGLVAGRRQPGGEVVVGVEGRPRPAADDEIGDLDRLLPVRVDLSADPSFSALVRQVDQRLALAHRNADVPFAAVRAQLHRDGVQGPLHHVRLVREPAAPSLRVPGVDVTRLDLRPPGDVVTVRFRQDAAEGTLAVDRDAAGGARLLREVRDALVTGLGTSQLPISRLAPVAPGERRQLSELEEHVTTLWAQTLRIERPAVDADFFELGGTSFQVVTIMTRLERSLGFDVPIDLLFEGPHTIEHLARQLELLQWMHRDAADEASGVPVPGHDEGEL